MECVICKQGETAAGLATVSLQRDDATIIIKEVPADICENCGEYYLSETISERVLAIAEKAIENNAVIEVLRFAA